jgi:hypothetical protein
MNMKTSILIPSLFCFAIYSTKAQLTSNRVLGGTSSPSAMFLLIPPDAVAGALGWSGVAADSNSYSEFYNPAQTSFLKSNFDLTVGYHPWLRALVPNINYTNISLKIKTNQRNTINISYIYISYGDKYAMANTVMPVESSIGLSEAYLLNKSSSVGLKIKYIQSNNLLNSFDIVNSKLRNFHSLAFALSYYHTHAFALLKKPAALNFGASLDNVGGKIGNDTLNVQAFIPTTLRVGQSIRINLSDEHELTFQYDVYELATPSTAPGGFKEKIKEIHFCGGVEYGYDNTLFVRAGYFHESPANGHSQFYTIGGALRYSSAYTFEVAVAYLIPIQQRNPFENTLSFSLRVY